MSLSTYTTLQASVADWLNRADLTSQVVDFIRLAEAELDRHPSVVSELKTQITLSASPTALPADCREVLSLYFDTPWTTDPASTRSQGTYTLSASHLADGDTLVIGGKTYTFKNTVSTTNGYVYLPTGSDDAADLAALDNLVLAVNLTGTAGTSYGTATTKHTMVSAGNRSGRTVVFTARAYGAVGNMITLTEVGTAGSVDGGGYLGGTTTAVGNGNMEISGSHRVIAIVDPQLLVLRKGVMPATGRPQAAAIVDDGENLLLAPVPDQAYTAEIIYTTKLTPLSGSVSTNWLLDSHPDIYLYGSLVQSAPFLKDDPRLPMWQTMLDRGLVQLGDLVKRRRQASNVPDPIARGR